MTRLDQVEAFITQRLTAGYIPTASDISHHLWWLYQVPMPRRPNLINGRYSQLRIKLFREAGLVKTAQRPADDDLTHSNTFSGRWRFPDEVNS